MLPVDLLVRLGEAAIGWASDATRRKMSTNRDDSASALGHDLLAYYFYLDEYARESLSLAHTVSWIRRDIEKGINLDATLDRANAASRRLSELVGKLIDVMWPTLNREYKRAANEMFDREPSARAEHRARVLSVLDPELVALVEVAYMTDMQLIYVARRLNALVFDADKMEVRSTMPHDQSLSAALSQIRHVGLESGSSEWEPPEPLASYSLDSDSEQLARLETQLRENADAVEALRKRMAAAIRAHFTVGDLV